MATTCVPKSNFCQEPKPHGQQRKMDIVNKTKTSMVFEC